MKITRFCRACGQAEQYFNLMNPLRGIPDMRCTNCPTNLNEDFNVIFFTDPQIKFLKEIKGLDM